MVARIRPVKWLLLLAPVILLQLNGCRSANKSDGASTQQPAASAPEPNIRLVVRQFLRTMPADWDLISPAELAKTNGPVVDVRQPEEYAAGSIEGALNVPIRGLLDNLQVLPGTDTEFVLVCDSGHRSAVAMGVLQMLGYTRARSLEGGLKAWRREKMQLASNPEPKASLRGGQGTVDPQLRSMLSYYLSHTLPVDWGAISPERLTEDQKRKSSTELDPMAETFDQGRSVLIAIDDPTEVATAHLSKALNLPLRRLPDDLSSMKLEPALHWA
jgi:rhodanese-related sulfurtransferase